jgi:hypothetical protein
LSTKIPLFFIHSFHFLFFELVSLHVILAPSMHLPLANKHFNLSSRDDAASQDFWSCMQHRSPLPFSLSVTSPPDACHDRLMKFFSSGAINLHKCMLPFYFLRPATDSCSKLLHALL